MAVARTALLTTALLATLTLSGCGGGSEAPAADTQPATSIVGGSATIGALHITGAYIPAPASTAVAAAYFTVTNSSSVADRLMSISSPTFGKASLMTNRTTADGGDVMVMLAKPQVIPARGSLSLQTGGMHTMLEQPRRQLKQGESVHLTLRFANAGQVSLLVPVVAMTGLPMTSMSSMPGM